jgi:hypothetical protein
MSRFLTQLSVRREDRRDIGKWILNVPLVYQSDVAGRTIKVPAGFSTDFASVPRWLPFAFAWLGGHGDSAATVHDFLYTRKPVSRRMADLVLREALAASYVARWRIPLFYWGVRLFGWSHWR